MRGERGNPSQQAEAARKIITDAATEAANVLAKAERKRAVSTAVIIGPDGSPLFHIVSTWWSRTFLLGSGVMLAIILLLTILVYYNKAQLNTLQEKVDENKAQQDKK
jgi:hypothetical protein